MRLILFAALLVFSSGCATIVRGTKQQVSVNTNPVGASIQFSNGQSCLAPCSIVAPRDASLLVTVTKNGCQTQTATLVPTLSGGGVILGSLIDYGTGAVYDLQPNPLTLTLACEKPEPVSQGLPTQR